MNFTTGLILGIIIGLLFGACLTIVIALCCASGEYNRMEEYEILEDEMNNKGEEKNV